MLVLYVESPFAVARAFTAGWFRPTATFITPSAAYGLLLNVACIEMRLREEDKLHTGKVPATVTRKGLPALRLAIGASAVQCKGRQTAPIPKQDRFPSVQSVFQQLHNYLVGPDKVRAAAAYGNKYNITPVRRELLVDLRAIIVADGNDDLEARIRDGLAGKLPARRYGLPFLGDNAFLLDRVELLDQPPETHWYERVSTDQTTVRPRTTRLTYWIDRAEMSNTKSDLFAPSEDATSTIPENAWIEINPP